MLGVCLSGTASVTVVAFALPLPLLRYLACLPSLRQKGRLVLAPAPPEMDSSAVSTKIAMFFLLLLDH